MVRFIMNDRIPARQRAVGFTFHYGQIYYVNRKMFLLRFCQIYIPLWLDLLLFNLSSTYELRFNLHSTMVRFIMGISAYIFYTENAFTFHYGQIYYCLIYLPHTNYASIYIPLWLDLLFTTHSLLTLITSPFTFHYGQIYYPFFRHEI